MYHSLGIGVNFDPLCARLLYLELSRALRIERAIKIENGEVWCPLRLTVRECGNECSRNGCSSYYGLELIDGEVIAAFNI
jgi:hypothetical protein